MHSCNPTTALQQNNFSRNSLLDVPKTNTVETNNRIAEKCNYWFIHFKSELWSANSFHFKTWACNKCQIPNLNYFIMVRNVLKLYASTRPLFISLFQFPKHHLMLFVFEDIYHVTCLILFAFHKILTPVGEEVPEIFLLSSNRFVVIFRICFCILRM